MEHVYKIQGIHCQSCVGKVKDSLSALESITDVKVDLKLKEVSIKMEHHIPITELNESLKSAGNYSLAAKESSSSATNTASLERQSLKPLVIIFAYIMLGVLISAKLSGDFSLHSLMRVFMGVFFVVFSLFKMIDLSGFADGYSTYDVLAKRSRIYALMYPFIELGLGVTFLLNTALVMANVVTVIVMAIGAIGVGKALRERRSIQCACLGTALKLPMTKVTLAEDILMGAMAAGMLLTMH